MLFISEGGETLLCKKHCYVRNTVMLETLLCKKHCYVKNIAM